MGTSSRLSVSTTRFQSKGFLRTENLQELSPGELGADVQDIQECTPGSQSI